MNIDEIKQKFNQAFGKFEFVEKGHYYLCNGKKIGISTTGLIHQYTNEFDSDTIAERVAKKRGISKEEVLEEWRIENLHSTIKGTMIHEYAQSLWLGKEYQFDYSKVSIKIDINRLKKDIWLLQLQAENHYNDYKDKYTLIGIELYLGDLDYDECGATDIVFLENETGKIIVSDFKTNKEIVYETKYNQKMKVPLQDYDDVNFTHYSLQLSDYSYKITKNTGLEIARKEIIYFNINNDNYEIIEPLDMENEAKKILEIRRNVNMNSVPVLIYGKSGTGKSTSLRNFKDDEVGIINVLGKPLPFRNKLKSATTDDYASILKVISGTKKKTIIIDDAGYLITNEFMRKSSVKGYDKFNEIANNFWNLIETIKKLEGGKTVYIMMHEDTNDNGDVAPRTIGKMLNDKVCVEGMFTIVLRSMCDDGKYIFTTKTNGQDVTKTPMGMFENEQIDNDLKEVDKIVREYYDLDKKEEEK